ncbi:hypothetical protein PD716_16155 [Vibrio gigantis]|uniref:glucosamine inositolphosphorylceramide transferase family protein n=1 Tax=Vibrio gigantis TaxID=296199 RepID=UPI002FC8E43B
MISFDVKNYKSQMRCISSSYSEVEVLIFGNSYTLPVRFSNIERVELKISDNSGKLSDQDIVVLLSKRKSLVVTVTIYLKSKNVLEFFISHRIIKKNLVGFYSSLSSSLFFSTNFVVKTENNVGVVSNNDATVFSDRSSRIVDLVSRVVNRFFFRDVWNVSYYKNVIHPEDIPDLFHDFIDIPREKGYFIADPFLLDVNGKSYIFYEKCKLVRGKGYLCCVDIDNLDKEIDVLVEEYHLSYPNVFLFDERLYMLPQSDNGKIDVYKCVEFPEKWEKVNTLIESSVFDFADTNIDINSDGVQRISTSIYADSKDSNRYQMSWDIIDFLNDTLDLSKGNIISLGDHHSRNAGQTKHGLRQNNLETYGGGLVYNAKKTNAISTPKSVAGIHTFNIGKSLTVIDYKVKKFGIYI